MKATLMFVMLFCITHFIFSQESPKYQKLKEQSNWHEGYIIDNKSVRTEGLIKEKLNEARNYSVVDFVYTDGTKKKFYPEDIKEFGHSGDKFVSDAESFYLVVQAGKVTLYRKVTQTATPMAGGPGSAPMTMYSTSESMYVKRDKEFVFKWVRKRKFAEDFSEYSKDCEEISSEIRNEALKQKDIEEIVRKYNACN